MKLLQIVIPVEPFLLSSAPEIGGPMVKGELSEERVDKAMDVLGHMERDFGVDDNEVVVDSKEEEPGVLESEGDIITALENQ